MTGGTQAFAIPDVVRPELTDVTSSICPRVAALVQHDGPTAFAIPGNHDWIDGLETFQRHILHKVDA